MWCLVCLLCHPSYISFHLAFAPFIPVLHVGLDIRLSTSQQTVAQGQLTLANPAAIRRLGLGGVSPLHREKVRKGSHHPAPALSSSCSRSCFLLLLKVFSLTTLNYLYSYFVLDLLLHGQYVFIFYPLVTKSQQSRVMACASNVHRTHSIFKKPSRTSTRYDPW